MSQTLQISVPDDMLAKLDQKAVEAGLARPDYLRYLLAKGLEASPSFDEILAPLRQQVAESGITDTELDALFREAREEVHRK